MSSGRSEELQVKEAYPGLGSYQDRHGRTRWRYRHKGRTVSLPAPDEPGFEEAYQAAVEGRKPRKAQVVAMPGAALPETLGAAYRLLKTTAKWIAYDAATRAKNTRLLEEFLASRIAEDHPLVWRDVQVRHVKRSHLEDLLGRHAATPHKAKHLLVAIRKLLKVAAREDWIENDPSALVEWRPACKGWKAWTPEAMSTYEARWPLGTLARTAYACVLYGGPRRSDVARFRWSDFASEQFPHTQQKTGKRLMLPVLPPLREALDAAPQLGEFILTTPWGTPRALGTLTNDFHAWTEAAGLKGCTMHGLRADSDEADHRFRTKAAIDSDWWRPGIPMIPASTLRRWHCDQVRRRSPGQAGRLWRRLCAWSLPSR